MKESLAETLKGLDYAYGVSGDESRVSTVLKHQMEGLYDDYFEDVLGNQFYVKYGKQTAKKLVLCAHLDEIGFAVNYIEEDGKARLLPVGFHDERLAVNQRLVALTEKGLVTGITGMIPFHFLSKQDREKSICLSALSLDFGTMSRAETHALGVQIGDYVAFEARGGRLNGGDQYSGKSVDNRAGCAVLVELFRQFRHQVPEVSVYFVGTVQEEVGMRAGGPVVNRLQPDLFLSIDLTLARGVPGIQPSQCCTEVGQGIAINYFDWDPELGMTGNNVPRKVTKKFVEIAEKNHIPYQRVVLAGGGTDAWGAAYAGMGTLCGVVLIPSQNVHSAVGSVHLDDLACMVKFLEGVIKEFSF